MIDDSHRSHDQRRLLTSYKIFVHLLLQEFQTSLYGIQTFLLRDIIYAILRILATCSSGNNGSVEDKLKLTLLCDLMKDVCNVAITVCPEVRSSVNICDRACENRPCECKLHRVIFLLISFVSNALSHFHKLQKKAH